MVVVLTVLIEDQSCFPPKGSAFRAWTVWLRATIFRWRSRTKHDSQHQNRWGTRPFVGKPEVSNDRSLLGRPYPRARRCTELRPLFECTHNCQIRSERSRSERNPSLLDRESRFFQRRHRQQRPLSAAACRSLVRRWTALSARRVHHSFYNENIAKNNKPIAVHCTGFTRFVLWPADLRWNANCSGHQVINLSRIRLEVPRVYSEQWPTCCHRQLSNPRDIFSRWRWAPARHVSSRRLRWPIYPHIHIVHVISGECAFHENCRVSLQGSLQENFAFNWSWLGKFATTSFQVPSQKGYGNKADQRLPAGVGRGSWE